MDKNNSIINMSDYRKNSGKENNPIITESPIIDKTQKSINYSIQELIKKDPIRFITENIEVISRFRKVNPENFIKAIYKGEFCLTAYNKDDLSVIGCIDIEDKSIISLCIRLSRIIFECLDFLENGSCQCVKEEDNSIRFLKLIKTLKGKDYTTYNSKDIIEVLLNCSVDAISLSVIRDGKIILDTEKIYNEKEKTDKSILPYDDGRRIEEPVGFKWPPE